MLLLAILADLTGKDAAQDAKIAALFTEPTLELAFRGQLQAILDSSLKVRTVVQKLLRSMSTSSKSEKLTNAIRDLVPEALVLPDNSNQ